MSMQSRKPLSAAVIMQVYKRDKFTCVYCGANGTEVELQCDHIHPSSKGGSNHVSNLRTSCRKCNQAKGNKINFNGKKTINMNNTYYFVICNKWYKTNSTLTDDILIVTVIDPSGFEYESKIINAEQIKDILFYSDFELFLQIQDRIRINNDPSWAHGMGYYEQYIKITKMGL
jgi:hypothetical protein